MLGLCALTRETWAHFAVLAALWAAWPARGEPRKAAARALVVLLAAAAVVLPWTVRNQGVQGRFVLISTNRWFPIAAGNVLGDKLRPFLDKKATRRLEIGVVFGCLGLALAGLA